LPGGNGGTGLAVSGHGLVTAIGGVGVIDGGGLGAALGGQFTCGMVGDSGKPKGVSNGSVTSSGSVALYSMHFRVSALVHGHQMPSKKTRKERAKIQRI